MKSFYNFINFVTTSIGIEYAGAEGLKPPPPKIFHKGGSAHAKILLNFMAVTILANPETLDVAKRQHSYIVSLFYSQIISIHRQL